MKILFKIFIMVVLFHTQTRAQDFWEEVNIPDSLTGIYALDINYNNDIFAFAVDSLGENNMHLFLSTDNGINWNDKLSFQEYCGFEVKFVVDSSEIFLAYLGDLCGAGGPWPENNFSIDHSPNYGNTWDQGLSSWNGNMDIEISPSGTVYSAALNSLYRWDEIIEDWIVITYDIECGWDHLAVNSKDELFVFQEISVDSLEILRSTDKGMSWDRISAYINEIGPDYSPPVILKCSPHDDLFLSVKNKIYKSSNNGEGWNLLSEGLSDSAITCLAINATGDVFAGTSGDGVYRLQYNGNSWAKVISGLTNLFINCLAIDSNDIIYTATNNFSGNYSPLMMIYKPDTNPECELFRSVKPTSILEIDKSPSLYNLSQNYPNPFNPSTTIEFTLPKSEFVELKVYNILGKEVANIVSNKLNQGNHTYQFDGKNLASGVYYYQLMTGAYTEVKKMIFLK